MADFEFVITSGPYAGKYEINQAELSGIDALDVRKILGTSLIEATATSFDVDVAAALVWLVRRRGSRGLAWNLVAEHINYGNFALGSDGEESGGADADPLVTLGSSEGG